MEDVTATPPEPSSGHTERVPAAFPYHSLNTGGERSVYPKHKEAPLKTVLPLLSQDNTEAMMGLGSEQTPPVEAKGRSRAAAAVRKLGTKFTTPSAKKAAWDVLRTKVSKSVAEQKKAVDAIVARDTKRGFFRTSV